ncbi:MAG: hypothetical protein ACP5GY_08690 [Vulcanisaeta sp.]
MTLRAWLGLTILLVITALTLVAYSLGYLTPSIVINTVVGKKPVNAFVQVFAVLPPGHRETLVEVWNGTSSTTITIYAEFQSCGPEHIHIPDLLSYSGYRL